MSSFRFDQLQMATTIPNFINIGTVPASISVSGTLGNGAGQNFQAQINVNTFSTFNEIKITNLANGKCTYLNDTWDIDAIYEFISTETVQNQVTFIGTLCTVQISIDNFTGGSITLTPQTFSIEIIEYQLPF